MRDGASGPLIHIEPRGNLGNRMIQYMVARAVRDRLGGGEIGNVRLPEWGIETPQSDRAVEWEDTVLLDEERHLTLDHIAAFAGTGDWRKVIVHGYVQRMELLGARALHEDAFAPRAEPSFRGGARDLVINVRAGELLAGVAHYPLVPIGFYRRVIEETALDPVFMGQLGDGAYCDALRAAFPRARFVPSGGAMADFETLRQAVNLVVGVSTFSWLGAWLSRAERVFLPLTGFFLPAHHPEVDLLPTGDPRWRFFLLPLNYGVPEAEALALHERLSARLREASAAEVDGLRARARALPVPRIHHVAFAPRWYAHTYLDAAEEIAAGLFADPQHHFAEAGAARGYRPLPPEFSRPAELPAGLADVAANRPATQSSTCEWSAARHVEQDAAAAVRDPHDDAWFFHTDNERHPWWEVDLGAEHEIFRVVLVNRLLKDLWWRATPLRAEVATRPGDWRALFAVPEEIAFGARAKPLTWTPPTPERGRFLRLTLLRHEFFHLARVRVFGRPATR